MRSFYILAITFSLSSCGSSIDSTPNTTPEVSYLANCSGETGQVDVEWAKSVEPNEIYINGLSPCISNGNGDKIEITSWSIWTADVATGVGRFGVNTYEPNGAAGNYDFYEITITLDSPMNGFFSKMHLSWTVKPPTAMQSYDVRPMSFNEGLLLNGPEADCDTDLGWTYNDSFPIEYCNHGRGVEFIQNALGLNIDGYFGWETWKALGKFQIDNGLTEFVTVGPETWVKLYPYQEGLPGRDYNGDGLVTPDEFGE